MRTKIIITIDTEVSRPEPSDAFNHDVLGTTTTSRHGSYWIASRLAAYRFPGVFFLDVYGKGRYPEAGYVALCEKLLAAGQDIQLHTHPDQMYDSGRYSMHEYSLEEQTGIIANGIELLKRWTGVAPIAHRAGRYGANEDTLRALRANGILLDSSFFFGRENCKLPYRMSNLPFVAQGVLEIPVTVAPIPIAKLGWSFPHWTTRFWRRYQKLDVNCMPARNLCDAIVEIDGHVPYMILFLHSFSFRRLMAGSYVPDDTAIEAFEAMLKLFADRSMPVVTFKDIDLESYMPAQMQPNQMVS